MWLIYNKSSSFVEHNRSVWLSQSVHLFIDLFAKAASRKCNKLNKKWILNADQLFQIQQKTIKQINPISPVEVQHNRQLIKRIQYWYYIIELNKTQINFFIDFGIFFCICCSHHSSIQIIMLRKRFVSIKDVLIIEYSFDHFNEIVFGTRNAWFGTAISKCSSIEICSNQLGSFEFPRNSTVTGHFIDFLTGNRSSHFVKGWMW